MYAFDNWYEPTDYYGVVWPAQNMPVEFFGSSYPWSISMGKDVDKSAVKVTLIRQSDQKKWAFSEKKADGYFNVENSNYGQKGCIIFRPENLPCGCSLQANWYFIVPDFVWDFVDFR